MLTFAYPYLLLLVFAPLLVRAFAGAHRVGRSALHVPFLSQIAEASGSKPDRGASVRNNNAPQLIILSLVWIGMVLAIARPQRIEDAVVRDMPGRDLLVAVDLSGSMEEEDFTMPDGRKVSRVVAVQEVLDDFLAKRTGDRVGLIFFGSAPFVQVPFTEDLDVCRALLAEAQPRIAGPQTMLGDAIGKAITVFDRSDLEEKVLILLTDGNDTGSMVPPVKAAQIAKDHGILIHTIGMGDPTSVGEEALDEKTLTDIAKTTGGEYFRAIDSKSLQDAYTTIDSLSERKVETLSYRPVTDLYVWPLAVGVVLSMLYHAYKALRDWQRQGRATA